MPKLGAYAGLGLRYAHLMGSGNLIAGIEAALLLDHRFAFRPQSAVTSVTLGYGGLLLRFHLLFDSPFVLSFAALAAAGDISVSRDPRAPAA
jgi:hypothetical protein